MWLFGQKNASNSLPPDRLNAQDLSPVAECLQAQSGIPATADACAYDPVQRLLAVSTSDGRVKIIGRDGVEHTLRSRPEGSPQPTKQLMFLLNRGVIVRLDVGGLLELWPVDAGASLTDTPHLPASTLSLPDDTLTCLDPLAQQPYLMMGTSSGVVRVAQLVNASGAPVTEARQARGLQLMPYKVRPKLLQAAGAVVALSSVTDTPAVRLLVVHAGSGAAVWDVRAQQLLAVVNTSNSAAPYTKPARGSGAVTAACWIHNPKRGDFVTGHEYGDVMIWALPASGAAAAGGVAAAGGEGGVVPTLLVQLHVAPPPCRAIRGLQHVYGKQENLLVWGGQDQDEPDGLVLLPLPKHNWWSGLEDPATSSELQQAAQAGSRRLPWYAPVLGHALVSPQGALTGFEDPCALLVLQEGGEVAVHDLSPGSSSQPNSPSKSQPRQQYVPTFQAQPMVTAARLRIIPTARVPLQGLQGASMTGLRDWAAASRPQRRNSSGSPLAAAASALVSSGRVSSGGGGSDPVTQQKLRWQWITDGGKAATPDNTTAYSLLYCTGHKDGRVRLWDMCGQVPLLLGVVPSAAAAAALGSRADAAAVSTLEFAWEQGLLITGHRGGEVRVFQFSSKPRSIDCVLFDSVGTSSNNATTPIEEPPGFQLRLLSTIHTADVCASTYAPTCKLVAVSDAAGAVSLIDLAKPAVRWMQAPWQQPVATLALGLVPLPPHSQRSELVARSFEELPSGSAVRAVVVASRDSCLTVLDANTGFPLSRCGALKPKHACDALALELLDPRGAPTWMARDVDNLVHLARHATPHKGAAQGRTSTPTTTTIPAAAMGEGVETSLTSATNTTTPGAGVAEGVDTTTTMPAALIGEGVAPPTSTLAATTSTTTTSAGPIAEGVERGTPSPSEGRGSSPSPNGPPGSSSGPLGGVAGPGAAGGGRGVLPPGVQLQGRSSSGASSSQGLELEACESIPEADLDDMLARAAAQVDEATATRRKSKHKGRNSPTTTTTTTAASSGSSSSSRPGSPDPGKSPGSPPKSSSKVAKGASRLAASSSSGNIAGEADKAAAAAGGGSSAIALDDPEAAYVLVATRQYLRLYPISHVVAGDRTAAKRVHLTGPLLFASCFAAAGGPALAALVQSGEDVHLQVYTLPGLELVSAGSLSAAAGWPWKWDPRHAGPRLPHVVAATRHGHLALLAPNSELVRFSLWTRAAAPLPPLATYDWDMAAAAHAAVTAFEQMKAYNKANLGGAAAAGGGGGGARGGGGTARGSPTAADAGGSKQSMSPTQQQQQQQQQQQEGGEEGGGAGRRSAVLPKDFKGFMTKIGQDFQRAGGEVARGLQKALDETQKGLQKVAQVLEDDFTAGKPTTHKGLPKEDANYPHPTLAALFEGTTTPALALRTKAAASDASEPGSPSNSPQQVVAGGVAPAAGGGEGRPGLVRISSARQSMSPRSTRRTAEMVTSAAAAAGGGGGAGGGPGPQAASRAGPAAGATRGTRLLGGGEDAARAALFEGVGSSRPAGGATSSSSAAASRGLGGVGGQSMGAGRGPLGSSGVASGSKVRSADEIRQAYGRTPMRKTYEIRNVMEENQQALVERGEKLSRLQDKAADLTETAAGFAEMAKMLAEKERQKSKWFGA